MAFDHWLTNPHSVLPLVREVMATITLDPSSNEVAQWYVQAAEYCVSPTCDIVAAQGMPPGVKHVDGLARTWHGDVFVNPPYSAQNIKNFVTHGMACLHETNQQIWLVNSATDTEWFHTLAKYASAVCLWKGRIKFWKIFDGEAHATWEGVLAKQRREKNNEGNAEIVKTNSPRYVNTLFYFGDNASVFVNACNKRGHLTYRT